MVGTTTLMEAARLFVADLTDDEKIASQAEVERFARWCGADRSFEQLHGQEVANYAETLTGGIIGASDRADAVRKFLAFAKKAGYSSTNLGTHLRVRKPSGARKAKTVARMEISVTPAEKEALTEELASLKVQRPQIVEDIRRAMSDKDFRENAPLDAARDRMGFVEGRIRTLEATLDNAVLIEGTTSHSGGEVDVGSTVVLHNLQSGAEVTYTLVRPSEVNPAQGRISFESPVGRALISHRAGEEVEVATPSGAHRFRIERVGA